MDMGEQAGVRLSILASLDNLVSFLLGDSMARKPRLFAPGVLYHVIVRGIIGRRHFSTMMLLLVPGMRIDLFAGTKVREPR
jgi:hypothetical protein